MKPSISWISDNENHTNEFVSIVSSDLTTPTCTIAHCGVINPSFISGNQKPRYKLVCEFFLEIKTHKKFWDLIQEFADANNVPAFGRKSNRNSHFVTFRSFEQPEIILNKDGKNTPISLNQDIPSGYDCKVNFNLKKYHDRTSRKSAFTFYPLSITFFLPKDAKVIIDDGNN